MRTRGVKISKNAEETRRIAKIFLGKILKESGASGGALTVSLSGNLGAGKTTFVQAVAGHLGVKSKVNSPTFLIIKKYPIKNKKYKFLFHLDAYRLKNEKELINLGWKEIIANEENIVFIEWPENVSKIIPQNSKTIHIAHGKNKERHFKID